MRFREILRDFARLRSEISRDYVPSFVVRNDVAPFCREASPRNFEGKPKRRRFLKISLSLVWQRCRRRPGGAPGADTHDWDDSEWLSDRRGRRRGAARFEPSRSGARRLRFGQESSRRPGVFAGFKTPSLRVDSTPSRLGDSLGTLLLSSRLEVLNCNLVSSSCPNLRLADR